MTDWHLGPLTAFDLETTGVDVREARIITGFAAIMLGRDGGRAMTARTHVMINPGVPIPPEATAVHGITDAEVQAKGWPPDMAVNDLTETLADSLKARIPIVGFNVAYDLNLLRHECIRHDVPTLAERIGLHRDAMVGPVIDAHVLDKHVDPYRKGSRKLDDSRGPGTATHYGVPLTAAHDAAADAIASVRVAVVIADRHPEIAGMSVRSLHLAQKDWRAHQMAGLQSYFRTRGGKPDAYCDPCWPLCVDPTHPSG